MPVSYKKLTLPTKREGGIFGGAGSFKKKKKTRKESNKQILIKEEINEKDNKHNE